MDLSYQEKKTVRKSVNWYKSRNNFYDTREFIIFLKLPVVPNGAKKGLTGPNLAKRAKQCQMGPKKA